MANDAMTLSPPGGFELISSGGASFTIPCKGQKLVLPSKNLDVFPGHNEFTVDANRLTIAESPWGGMKGTTSPGYTVGTIYTPTDGVYLQDKNGANTSKTLTAGKLKEVSCLTVDSSAKTITEEFIIKNDSTSHAPASVELFPNTTGWTDAYMATSTSITKTSDGSSLTFSGTVDGSYRLGIQKNYNVSIGSNKFLVFKITSSGNARLHLLVYGASGYVGWYTDGKCLLTANTEHTFVLPLFAPAGSTSVYPTANSIVGPNITKIIVGVAGFASPYTVTVKPITLDVGKPAYVEIQCPDSLADSSLTLQCWDSTLGTPAYATCRVCKLNSTFADVSSTPANVKFLDGTKADDVYGSTLGRAVFPKGASEATVTGSTGTMTFSTNKGTSKRIGLMISLPPSDSGRTAFNKVRMKTILSYTDTVGNKVSDLSGNNNTGTVSGAVIKSASGLYFDSADDKITLPVINNMLSTSGFTVVADVTPAGFSGNYFDRNIINSAASNGFDFRIGNGKLNFSLRNQAGAGELHSGTASLTAGQRYVLIMALNPTTAKGYINGVLDTSTTAPTSWNIVPTTAPIIGNYVSDLGRFFHGTIHGLAIYNGVWNQSQVTAYQTNQAVPSAPVYSLDTTATFSGSTTYEFSNSASASTGLQNLSNPWLALMDSSGNVGYLIFTERPNSISYVRDDSGTIYELVIDPGNSLVYRGSTYIGDQTTDTDGDKIPNMLEEAVAGSISNVLKCNAFNA